MEKALIVRGELEDLSDLLRIARSVGKQVLGVEKVRVLPFVTCYSGGYIVVVEPEGGRKSLGVGRGTARAE